MLRITLLREADATLPQVRCDTKECGGVLTRSTIGPRNEIEDESEDLYNDSRNGDGDDDGPTFSGHTQPHIEGRPATAEPVEGDHTGTATEIPEKDPQRDVKVETSTQHSGRHQLWPLARRAPPAMESLDNSDSE